jgi:hypothetical protein
MTIFLNHCTRLAPLHELSLFKYFFTASQDKLRRRDAKRAKEDFCHFDQREKSFLRSLAFARDDGRAARHLGVPFDLAQGMLCALCARHSPIGCPLVPKESLFHERRASRRAMLADGAIGFLFEGLIGLGRRDVFVLSPFRGWILFSFSFPFGFGRHSNSWIGYADATGASSRSSRMKIASKDWAKHLRKNGN